MLIGVPKEIKNHEYRVGLTPASVNELAKRGHQIIVETDAGASIDFPDGDYVAAGGQIVASAAEIFRRADMVVKGRSLFVPKIHPRRVQAQQRRSLYTSVPRVICFSVD